MKEPRILILDIENSANLGWYYDRWKKGNIVSVHREWHLLSFAYKWLGESKIHVYALPDFKGYTKDRLNDEKLTEKLHEVMSQCDVFIGHNSDKFDIRKANARFIKHGLEPVEPYASYDTLKIARKHFDFPSNRLGDIAKFLGFEGKHDGMDFPMWERCIAGDMTAWAIERRYNARDVALTEKVYLKFRPWGKHPNVNIVNQKQHACRRCGSKEIIKKGFGHNKVREFQKYQCLNCFGWSQEPLDLMAKATRIKIV